jgi:Cu(I)/Ag(I) efflux system membrane fusion protein
MNKTILISIVVTAFLAAFSGYWVGSEKHTSDQISAPGSIENEPLFYRNPMNPAITSAVPAKDEMGMDYIPVYADGDGASMVPGTVLIDPVTTQSIGVRTSKAVKRTMAKHVHTLGRIDYDETTITRLHPKTEGWIEAMRVQTTGQTIKADEILLSIYSPQLVSAQEEYLLALGSSGMATASELAKSALRRLELLDVPAHQITELKQTGDVKKYLHIHSPTAGTVISVGARNGQYVTPMTELYFIADLSRVWVYVDVFEDELSWVSIGDKAEMSVSGLPGKTFTGELAYIYPYADRKTRTIKARLDFENVDRLLKPEMYVDIKIAVKEKRGAIVIPTEAIVRSGTREKVFIQLAEGKFEPREVEIGVSSEGWTEILEGVELGEPVVTSAQFLIDSESKLREAVAKMSSGQPPMDHSGHDMSAHEEESEHQGHNMNMTEPDHSRMDHSAHQMSPEKGDSDEAHNHD